MSFLKIFVNFVVVALRLLGLANSKVLPNAKRRSMVTVIHRPLRKTSLAPMEVALWIRVPFFVHLFTLRSFLCVRLNRVSFSAEILEVIVGFFFMFNPFIISLLAFARFFFLPPSFLLVFILILFLLRLLFLLLILILSSLSI